MKYAIMQVTYFLNDSVVNMLFGSVSGYYMLRGSDSLKEIQPQSYSWSPNCLDSFSILILSMEV